MGILSSLFQTGAPTQQVAGPVLQTAQLPKELAPYYKDILGKAQALYNERTKEGFQPYQGPTMADFTPEQQQAFTGISGLVGQQAPVFQEAMDLTRSAAAPMTSEQMTQYMSPYQQAVTDIEKREATKQYESQVVPALAAKAATTGGFGGSRQAILEGMAADTQQRLLSDIQAKGSQQAYQDAVQRFQADRQAAGQAGAQLATMAPQQFKAQLGELGAIQTVGEQQQRQQQTALDEAFRQYQLERNYPYDTMSRYQSVVTGAPMGTTTFAQPAPPAPSTAQTLLGGLGTLVGTYGAFGGKLPNVFGAKQGGGIADTMVYRDKGGYVFQNYPAGIVDVHPDYGYRPRGFSGEINQLQEKTYPRDITEADIFNMNYDKLSFGDKMHLQTNNYFQNNDFTSRNKVLADYMGNKIEGQRRYEGSPFEGNTNTIVESRISGETIVPPENKLLSQTPENYIAAREQEKITGNIGTETPPNFPIRGEFEGQPQGQEIETNRDTVNVNRGDIDAGYGTPVPEGIKTGIASVLEQRNLNVTPPKQIANTIQGPTRRDKFNIDQGRIQAEENSLMKLMKERTKGRKKQLSESKEAQNRENWLNVAQLFSRLGSATPRQEGIMGVIGAGLEAADQTLPQFAATNAKFRNERREIQNDIEDDKINQAQTKLNALEKRAKKEHDLYIEERDERRFKRAEIRQRLVEDRAYQVDIADYNLKVIEANLEDPAVTKQMYQNFDELILGATITEAGGKTFIEGKALTAEGNTARLALIKKYIQDVKNPEIDEATAIQNAQDGFKALQSNTAFFEGDEPTGPGVRITSQKEFDDLAVGTVFIGFDGKKRIKK